MLIVCVLIVCLLTVCVLIQMQRRLAERREARKLAALKQAARRHSVPTAARRSSPGDGSALVSDHHSLAHGQKEWRYALVSRELTDGVHGTCRAC